MWDNAEVQVLGAVMLDPTVLDEVRSVLRPDDFAESSNRLVFRTMTELADKGAPIDPMAIHIALDSAGLLKQAGGVEYVSGLEAQCLSSVSAGYYAGHVAAIARKKRIRAIGQQLASASSDDDGAELAERAMGDLYDAVSSQRRDSTESSAPEALSRLIESVENAQNNGSGVTGIPSGFAGLDKVTSGWCPGDLVLLAARTGVGKSTMATGLARTALTAGHSVAYVTLEMTVSALLTRMVAAAAQINEARLRTGTSTAQELALFHRQVSVFAADRLTWDAPHKLTISDLRSRLRIWKRKDACDLVIVDQLGNLTATTRENRVQQVAEISHGLKGLAREFSVPIIALHQINRDGDSRTAEQRPELRNLKDSGATEEDADTVLLMHRMFDARTQSEGAVELCAAKTRCGPSYQTVTLNFHGSQTRFSSADSPRYASHDE